MLIKDLFQRHNITPTGILHVGAHEGQEGPIYDKVCNHIIWVEGNPDIYNRLMVNRPNDTHIKALVSDAEGELVDFKISSNDGQSSSILELGTHKAQHPSVRFVDSKKLVTTTISRLFQVLPTSITSSLDFLVMDIQGMELRALKGMGDILGQFKWVYLEVNREEVYKECGLVEEVDQYLSQFGFIRIETKWAGGWGDAYYSRKS